MREEDEEVARGEYGKDLVMAAIRALEKSDSNFRIIHDAKHGVRVNPRSRPRDQVRYPGIPPKKKKILARAARLAASHP
eukprot:12417371-Karenia_brevis.AAC.1